jgi:hypothetical protein
MADLHPLFVCSSVVKVSAETDGFDLHQVGDARERTFQTRVAFASPFYDTPVVHAALAGLDIDNSDTARISVGATNVDATGFDLVVTTWLGTRVYAAQVSWLAIGHSAA